MRQYWSMINKYGHCELEQVVELPFQFECPQSVMGLYRNYQTKFSFNEWPQILDLVQLCDLAKDTKNKIQQKKRWYGSSYPQQDQFFLWRSQIFIGFFSRILDISNKVFDKKWEKFSVPKEWVNIVFYLLIMFRSHTGHQLQSIDLDATGIAEDSDLRPTPDQQKQRKILQEKRKYRQESINKTKEIRRLVRQNQEFDKTIAKLTLQNKRLTESKLQLIKTINYLEAQFYKKEKQISNLKMKIEQNTSQVVKPSPTPARYIEPGSEPENPLNRLKSMKRFGAYNNNEGLKDKNKLELASVKIQEYIQQRKSMISTDQHARCRSNHEKEIQDLRKSKKEQDQRLHSVQQQHFEAIQEIKRLKIQITCLKRKTLEEVQLEKKIKSTEYADLKKRFSQLLSQHTELIKKIKRLQISEKVKNKLSPIPLIMSGDFYFTPEGNSQLLSSSKQDQSVLSLSHYSLSSDDSQVQ